MAVSEHRFEALGKSWRFKFGIGAICALEEEFNLPFFTVLQRVFPDLVITNAEDLDKLGDAMLGVRLSDVRTMFRCGLLTHHPEVTVRNVDDIIDELGMDGAGAIIRQAMASDMGGGSEASEGPLEARLSA